MSIKHRQFEPASEDTLQCFFFSSSLSEQESSTRLCENLNTRITTLAGDYIWHRDEFKVFVPIWNKPNEDIPLYLTSSTCFGDNIEDEWFIVHIILELTKQFTDLIVQVKDNDGDFLLIEAADYIPKWANPDSTDNRVFIYKNKIHIIPTNLASVEEDLKLSDALMCVIQNEEQTLAASEIQQAISGRIGNYPIKHKENTHNAIVLLPLEIAALLKMQPKLIAPIVNSCCHHDAIDIKTFKTLDYHNTVTVSVKFTKCLYAMLLHSKNIKHIMNSEEKSITLGKKITFGFRMIMNRSSDMFSSKEYHKFKKSLSVNGYFKGNMEGSQEYQKLLKEANNYFSSVECPITSGVASMISEIITSDKYQEAKDLLLNLTTSSNLLEDNEDWLKIHPDQLTNLLNSRYGKKTKFENKDIITPQNISKQLTDFLKKSSDYEGIETVDKEQENNAIEFDPEQFVNSVEKMLKMLSTAGEQQDESDFSDDDDDDISVSVLENDDLDIELKDKLQSNGTSLNDNQSILKNIISSLREEQASSGPSSNLMNILGHSKSDFLDSDDE